MWILRGERGLRLAAATTSVDDERTLFACAALGAFALYACTAAPTATWLDSTEWATAAATFGVAHPPAHPAYVLLTKLGLLLPGGEQGFRANLASGGASALAAGFCALMVRDVAHVLLGIAPANLGQERKSTSIVVFCGALLTSWALCCAGSFWYQAIRAEVYAFQTALALALSWIAIRWVTAANSSAADLRWPLVASLLVGVGGANHHYLMVLVVPGLIAALLASPQRAIALAPRRLIPCVALMAAPLLAYAALPLFSLAHPPLDWTHPTTWSRWVDTVLARAFHASVTEAGLPSAPGGDAVAQLFSLMEHLQPLAVVAAVCAFALVALRHARLALVVALIAGGNQLSTALMDFDPSNPDAWGYLGLSHAWVSILAGALVTALATSAALAGYTWLGGALAGGTLLTWVVAQAATWGPMCALSRFAATELAADSQLQSTPPGSLVGTYYFSSTFNLGFAQGVQGRRPDVALFNQTLQTHLYGGEIYAAHLARTLAGWRELFGGLTPSQGFPTARVAELSRARPIWLEPDMDSPLSEAVAWAPLGPLTCIGPSCPSADESAQLARVEASWTRLQDQWDEHGGTDRWSRAWLLWQHTQAAGQALRHGLSDIARLEIGKALALNPESPALHALEALSAELDAMKPQSRRQWQQQVRGRSLLEAIGLHPRASKSVER